MCSALIALALPSKLAAAEASVSDVRIASHGNGTRVVIDLDRRVSFRHVTLDQPPRLAIDLPDVDWKVPENGGFHGAGLVEGLRFGRPRPGVARIVLDVAQPFQIDNVFELPPSGTRGHRIVTDLVGAFAATNGAAEPAAGPEETLAAALVVGPLPRKKPQPPSDERIIVLDPGHGGVDPGAIGSSTGIFEKDIALEMGLKLREQLEATGRYKVVMTRDSDRIVRLRDRLLIARESQGELFLSLHADSLKKAPDVAGASIYTLSERASNDEAARLASKENRAGILAGVDLSEQEDIVTEILIDLAQRDANNKSIRIAELLVDELGDVSKLAKRRRSQAGFVVLKSPDMPSVLIELGYLSNSSDEKALGDPAHIAKLAAAMVRATDRFFSHAR